MRRAWQRLAVLVLAAIAAPAGAGDPAPAPPTAATQAAGAASPAQDAALQAAREAFRAGDRQRLSQRLPELAGHPLADYAEFWLLALRLQAGEAQDAEARDFLARHPGTWLADRLRAEWLLALGARGELGTLDAESHALVWGRDEPQLRCYLLLARYALAPLPAPRGELAREARRQLATTASPGGDGCEALAERLLDDRVLSPWARLRALLERDQAGATPRVAARLTRAEQAACRQLSKHPQAWLRANHRRVGVARAELATLALLRLAREDPEAAAEEADRWQPALSPEQRGAVWGRVGQVGSRRLLPEAAAWFRRGGEQVGVGPDSVGAPEVLEAEVRAALRREEVPAWDQVLSAIDRMPPEQQADPAWIYWRARAEAVEGRDVVARGLLAGIAGRPLFYGQLAAEDLGLPLRLPRPPPPAEGDVDAIGAHPGLARAVRLYGLGLRDEANHEWGWELRGMDDRELLAAAEYARRQGLLDRMIMSSERTKELVDLDQRYPRPYRELLGRIAAPLSLDPAWIYGLMRQESRFIQQAMSSSGAIGLMQLLPGTARYVARRIGAEGYTPARVAEPELNLLLGANYMKMVLDDQDGHELLASAAYNAGPRRAREWRAALRRPLEGAIFAETIPVTETRDYVKKVLYNAFVYAVLLDDRVGSLKATLGTVGPKPVPATELP